MLGRSYTALLMGPGQEHGDEQRPSHQQHAPAPTVDPRSVSRCDSSLHLLLATGEWLARVCVPRLCYLCVRRTMFQRKVVKSPSHSLSLSLLSIPFPLLALLQRVCSCAALFTQTHFHFHKHTHTQCNGALVISCANSISSF